MADKDKEKARNLELATRDLSWTERDIGAYIEERHEHKDYRPVVVSVLFDQGKVLLTKTPIENAQTPWSFPQGGIDLEETLREAMLRELKEELGMENQDFSRITDGVVVREIPAETGRPDKRGFTKGKAYLAVYAVYTGSGELVLQPEEVAETKWLTIEEAISYLELARPEKAEMLIDFLNQSLKFR